MWTDGFPRSIPEMPSVKPLGYFSSASPKARYRYGWHTMRLAMASRRTRMTVEGGVRSGCVLLFLVPLPPNVAIWCQNFNTEKNEKRPVVKLSNTRI